MAKKKKKKNQVVISLKENKTVSSLVTAAVITAAGFGFYTYQTLPQLKIDLDDLESLVSTKVSQESQLERTADFNELKENLAVLQKEFDALKIEFAVMSTHMPRAHVSWREYDQDIERMKEERDQMEQEIKDLFKALARQP